MRDWLRRYLAFSAFELVFVDAFVRADAVGFVGFTAALIDGVAAVLGFAKMAELCGDARLCVVRGEGHLVEG